MSEIPMLDAETLKHIRSLLVIESCHTTGMHDPQHTPQYFCQSQKANAFDRLLEALEIDIEHLPRRLVGHTAAAVPNQQEYRDQAIREWAWAAGAPMEIFRPGRDVPRKGDEDKVLAVLTDEFQSWQIVTQTLGPGEPEGYFDPKRYWSVIRLLGDKIEQYDISVRLRQKEA